MTNRTHMERPHPQARRSKWPRQAHPKEGHPKEGPTMSAPLTERTHPQDQDQARRCRICRRRLAPKKPGRGRKPQYCQRPECKAQRNRTGVKRFYDRKMTAKGGKETGGRPRGSRDTYQRIRNDADMQRRAEDALILFEQGRTQRQIAQTLHVSINHVGVLLRRAREQRDNAA